MSARTVPPLQASSLVREYGGRRVVDGVDVEVAAGECLALFGPNGAGKTTLLRMMAGLLRPTAGSAQVAGLPVRGAEGRGRVGLVTHGSMLYGALTALENVELAARLHGVPTPRQAALDALAAMRVADRAGVAARALSRGLQQRVSIARAIVHDPRAVLLDEPFTGLDDAGASALTEALTELSAHGAALLLVTHNVTEGLALAGRVAVMVAGRIVRTMSRSELEPRAFADEYRVLARGGASAVAPPATRAAAARA